MELNSAINNNFYHKICVFCGASERISDEYIEIASVFGEAIGKFGKELIYGGGDSGLMGVVSRAARLHGSKVTGIFPKCITDMERMSNDKEGLILVNNLFDRKELMLSTADAFVVLPGGIGTLDEFFEVVTLQSLNVQRIISKPIFILNYNGFWDHLIALLEHMMSEKFMREDVRKHYNYKFINTMDELLKLVGIE